MTLSSTTQTYDHRRGRCRRIRHGRLSPTPTAGANTVAEDAIVGTTVGVTGLATDADATDNVTYSLSDDAGRPVQPSIPTRAWSRSTAHSNTKRSSRCQPQRLRSDWPPGDDGSTSSQAFTITVTDVERRCGRRGERHVMPPPNAVDEDAIVGTYGRRHRRMRTPIRTAPIRSATRWTDDAGGRFAIDANTGIVTVDAVDAEMATPQYHHPSIRSDQLQPTTLSHNITTSRATSADATPIAGRRRGSASRQRLRSDVER